MDDSQVTIASGLQARRDRAVLEMEALQAEGRLQVLKAGSTAVAFNAAYESRIAESEYALGDLVDPRDPFFDSPAWFGSPGQLVPFWGAQDRDHGRDRPVINTELDLAYIRAKSRLLCDTNTTAIGALGALVNYVVGVGFNYKFGVQKRYQKGMSPEMVQAFSDLTQEVADEFMRLNRWAGEDGLERENYRRLRRDGEFFLSVIPIAGGRAAARHIEPGYISAPTNAHAASEVAGLPDDTDWEFGVAAPPEDIATPLGYWVRWMGQSQRSGDEEFYSVDELVHVKINTDRNVKRGLPDFYSPGELLGIGQDLMRNTGVSAKVQAAISFIREHGEGVTQAQAQSLASTNTLIRANMPTPSGGVLQRTATHYPPGTVLDVGTTQYKSGAWGSNGPNFVAISQGIIRMAGCRWNMPEFIITGDASNANYASTFVAESPFVRFCETSQGGMVGVYHNIFLRVFKIAHDAGRFDRLGMSWEQFKAIVDTQITPPQVAVRDKDKEANRRILLMQQGILSKKTATGEEGYDWEDEQANIAEERAADLKAQTEETQAKIAAGVMPDLTQQIKPSLGVKSDVTTGGPDADATESAVEAMALAILKKTEELIESGEFELIEGSFDESLHPRAPKGSQEYHGGRWIKKTAAAAGERAGMPTKEELSDDARFYRASYEFKLKSGQRLSPNQRSFLLSLANRKATGAELQRGLPGVEANRRAYESTVEPLRELIANGLVEKFGQASATSGIGFGYAGPGSASATSTESDDESRTIYALTEEGRKRLAEWLGFPIVENVSQPKADDDQAKRDYDAGTAEYLRGRIASAQREYEDATKRKKPGLQKQAQKKINDLNKQLASHLSKAAPDKAAAPPVPVKQTEFKPGTKLSQSEAAELIKQLRSGDARSKNKGSDGGPEIVREPHIIDRVPIAIFDREAPDDGTYLNFIKSTTSPARVAAYVRDKVDTPIAIAVTSKGLPVVSDGGHRLTAAIERGEKDILAIMPQSLHDKLNAPVKQTDTPAFKKWFGESKVVDEKGKPLVVYHGTGDSFAEFTSGKGRTQDAKQGFFFSASPSQADRYAWKKGDYVGIAMPVYLRVTNPHVIDAGGKVYNPSQNLAAMNDAKANGNDGVLIRNAADPWGEVADHWAVFEPNQIKSATGNRGTFDPSSNDIRESAADLIESAARKLYGVKYP